MNQFAKPARPGQGHEDEALREMLAAFGPRFCAIAEEYCLSLPQRLAALRDAAEMNAPEVLAAAAHRLAGGSASLGGMEVSKLCRALETDCGDGSVPADWQGRLANISLACLAFSERLQALEKR